MTHRCEWDNEACYEQRCPKWKEKEMWNDYVVEGYPKKNSELSKSFDHAIRTLRIQVKTYRHCANLTDLPKGYRDGKEYFEALAQEHRDAANILENLSKLKKFTRPKFGQIGTRDVDVAEQIKIWESIFGVETCDLCEGASGAVPGNGNIINGQVVCDYCSVKTSKEP